MGSIKVDKSVCQKFVRITVNGQSVVLPIGDWSRLISRPGEFAVTAQDKLRMV